MHGEGVRVLIVGAGIAGLAAARALGAWGAAVEVVERAPGPATAGTGIYLPGNAVRALDALGLAEAVTGRAVRIERQHTADHRGRALFDVDVARWWSGVGPCVALHRADLQQALLTGIGDVPISWGQTIREAAADHGGVRIELSSGRTVRYDLVLGADGVHSTVRQLMVDAPSVRPVGQRAWRFVAPCSEQAPVWSVQLGRGSAFLTIPIGDGQLYCYCDAELGDPRPLRDLFAGYAEPVPALLDTVDATDGGRSLHVGPIEEVVLDTWSRGGVLLIGDAAHATSPNMAQGAAMAFEDAVVLAKSLTAADNIAEALAAYERRRRHRFDWIRTQTHRRDRARRLPGPLRSAVLRVAGERIYRANYQPLLAPP